MANMGLFGRKDEQEKIVSASIAEWMENQTGGEAILDQEQVGEMLTCWHDHYSEIQQAARRWIAEHPDELSNPGGLPTS